MTVPSVSVDDGVKELFRGATLGLLYVSDIDNAPDKDPLASARSEAVQVLRDKHGDKAAQTIPQVGAWRDAYRRFGTSHKKATPTLEAIVRRVLTKGNLPRISPIVDAYLVTEIEHLVPFGGYDILAVSDDIVLRRSEGGEDFRAVGSEDIEETNAGEVVYADASRVLTRHWNYRDCDFTKITPATTSALVVCEVLPIDGVDPAERIIGRLADLILTSVGGTADVRVIQI